MPLSAKQMEYLALAWQCFDSEPKIDYNKFATVAGLKTAASARELMRVTKNKLKDEYGALSTTMQSTNAATASPTKSPSKKAANGGTPKATPTSKKRARKSAAVDEDAEADGTDEEVEHSPAPKKAKAKAATTPAKGAKRAAAKEVKTEPGQENENELGGEGDVNFF